MAGQTFRRQKEEKKEKVVIASLVGVVIFLSVFYVNRVNESVTDGEYYHDLQEHINRLQNKNSELKVEISQRQSLGYIDAVARQQGFTEAEFVYLK